MRVLHAALLAGVLVVPGLVQGSQIPFHIPPQEHISKNTLDVDNSWSFDKPPAPESTSHLIFDTVGSLLQHWQNTRYRNGHTLVPATVPVGTLLYHGTNRNELPKGPEWTATDPEHSYLFCRGFEETGCWHLTLVTVRPLKLLYFDGSSAAKMFGGPMDTQDLVLWGKVRPEKTFEEWERIQELCDWGKQFNLDGFVRMEMDFEVLMCNFTAGVETVSFLNLATEGRGGAKPPPKKKLSQTVFESEDGDNLPPARESPSPPGSRPPPPPPSRGGQHHGEHPPPPSQHDGHEREHGHDRSRPPPSRGGQHRGEDPPPPPHHGDRPPPEHEHGSPPRGPPRRGGPPPERRPKGSPPPPPDDSESNYNTNKVNVAPPARGADGKGFFVIESGSWHNSYPGDTRIQLDLAGLVSLYDTALIPSLISARAGKERWDHRGDGISEEDVASMMKLLGSYLKDGEVKSSGVDWKTLFKAILNRYADRLEVLQYILNNSTSFDTSKERLASAHRRLTTMLAPYLLQSVSPPNITEGQISNSTWAAPIFQHCATTHTRSLSSLPGLTYSEKLLLQAAKDVSKEICRVLVGMYAEGVELGLHEVGEDNGDVSTTEKDNVQKWSEKTESLMAWLDWGVWIKCRPACGFEEICYLPTWPFFRNPRGPGAPPRGPRPPIETHGGPPDDENEGDDWLKPQPKCIRRVEPFTAV